MSELFTLWLSMVFRVVTDNQEDCGGTILPGCSEGCGLLSSSMETWLFGFL